MRKTKKALCLQGMRFIPAVAGKPCLCVGMLAFAAILCFGSAGIASPAAQEQGSYLEEGELNAYDAAKKEPDSRKRAVKLMEFMQKYPKSVLMEASDFAEVRTIEEEYNAFYAAQREPDLEKRAEMLAEFLQKYPASSLVQNADYEYMKMLKEAAEGRKYPLIESLGERWIKSHPNDKDVYALVADADMHLGKYQRCGECLEEMYRIEPKPALAREIFEVYQKTENPSKQAEWADRIFKMPEFKADYLLRYDYMMKFVKSNDLAKAAEYAQFALESAALAEPKEAKEAEQLRKVRRACYHVIGSSLMAKGNFVAAISAFKQAVKAERYGQGYYEIAICLENQKDVEEAILYYAVTELMGEEDAAKAKTRLEVLYKALHNDTLIGIDKVYKKAKEMLAEPDKVT